MFQRTIAEKVGCTGVGLHSGATVELTQEATGVYARNLSRSQPTLVNGAPLLESKPLSNGDLLGNRGFIARVRLG